jgi:MFS family permease
LSKYRKTEAIARGKLVANVARSTNAARNREEALMPGRRTRHIFLNLGHAYDHLFMLLYTTVVLELKDVFGLSYGELVVLATPGFIAFGVGSLPSGWLGDHWSRRGMIAIFFFGISGSSVLAGLARSPLEIAVALTLVGIFASIYHPVGIAMLVQGEERTGRTLGINGVAGNLGVAAAALVAGALADFVHWRAAFIVPGVVGILTGLAFMIMVPRETTSAASAAKRAGDVATRIGWQRVLVVVAIATLFGGLIFNMTTVGLPKLFEERLAGLAISTFDIGVVVSIVFTTAAFTQIAVGMAIDRFPVKPVFLGLVALQVPVLFLATSPSSWAMVIVAVAMMALVFGQIPIADTLVARYTPDARRARVYAIKYLITFGVSAMAVPMLATIHDMGGGFTTLFGIAAGLAAVITTAVIFLPGRQAEAVPAPAE